MTVDTISGPASYAAPLRDSTVAKPVTDQPAKADSFGPAFKTDLSSASVSIDLTHLEPPTPETQKLNTEMAQWDIYAPWAVKNQEYTAKLWTLAKAQLGLDSTAILAADEGGMAALARLGAANGLVPPAFPPELKGTKFDTAMDDPDLRTSKSANFIVTFPDEGLNPTHTLGAGKSFDLTVDRERAGTAAGVHLTQTKASASGESAFDLTAETGGVVGTARAAGLGGNTALTVLGFFSKLQPYL